MRKAGSMDQESPGTFSGTDILSDALGGTKVLLRGISETKIPLEDSEASISSWEHSETHSLTLRTSCRD